MLSTNDVSRNTSTSDSAIDYSHILSQALESTSGSKSQVSALQRALKRHSNVFRNFAFRGLGFSISKSILDYYTVGFGVKIPLSANFPVYDSLIYLPRVGMFIGINYPLSFRISLSFSLPVQVLTTMAVLAYKQTVSNQTQATSRPFEWPVIPATDSVKRIGLTTAVRYSQSHGLYGIIGPNLMFIPSLKIIERLLPLMIFGPSVLLGAWLWLQELFMVLQNLLVDFIANKQQSQPISKNKSTSSEQFELDPDQDDYTQMSTDLSNAQKRESSFTTAWNMIAKWVGTKTPSFGSHAGCYNVHHSISMGSAFYFDLQPFHPFRNLTKRKRKSASKSASKQSHGSSSPAATSQIASPSISSVTEIPDSVSTSPVAVSPKAKKKVVAA